jgi:hypothetical protein
MTAKTNCPSANIENGFQGPAGRDIEETGHLLDGGHTGCGHLDHGQGSPLSCFSLTLTAFSVLAA